MKLKQFIFALVAMLSSFAFTANAQELLVNCDYNSNTEGLGTTKFSNYAGAYAYATTNSKTSATIVIEKTNTISGNCFDNNHKNYTKLKVVIKDGATMGNADFYVQDLDARGELTIEDSKVEVDGAFASATFYATTLTNTEMVVNGNLISGGLTDFSGDSSNQLGNVNINNSTLTIKEGDTKVAANVTATNSTINVNNLTVNNGKTHNLNEGSTLEAANITTEGNGSVKIDGKEAPIVDGAMCVPVSDFAALKSAVEAGKNVQLTANIATTSAIKTSGVASVIDLNGKTLTIGAGDNKFNDESNITIKNGTVSITGVTVGGNAIFCLDEYEKALVTTLTLDNVNVVGNDYSSAYGVFYIGESSVLNVNGGVWKLMNDTHASGGVFKADGSGAKLNIDGLNLTAHNVRRVVTYAATTIDNSTMAISGDADGVDAEMEHGFNRSPLAINNSTITMKDMVGRGITAQNGAVTISENSNVEITNCQEATIDVRNNQTVTIDNTSTVSVDKVPTIASGSAINGTVKLPPVAQVGDAKFETLAAAVAAVQDGQTVSILKAGTYALKVKDGITITGAVAGVEFANIGAFGCNGANVTFNNVTFTYAENSTYKGLQHSGNLVYNNCTFNGQVFLYGESETFNKCTFNTTDSNNYNVWTYGAKNVAFNECTFNSAGKSVLIYNESASVTNNVTVTKSTFKASQAVEGKAAIEMDSSLSGAINLTIDGETTATGFANGNVSGNSLWNNKKGNNDVANNDITVKVGDETVLAPAPIVVYYQDGTNEVFYDMLKAVPYTSNYPKLEGATIKLLADVAASGLRFMENNMVFDLNGHTYTITAGTGSQGTNTSGFQIRPEVTTDVTFKNGTIKVAEGAPVVYMFNNYATNFILEDVTVDCTNMAWSYGNSCYVVVSRGNATTTGARNVEFKGNTTIEYFNSSDAGTAYSIDGTMTVGENVECGGSFKLAAGATLTAKEGLNVETVDGYILAYNNGVYATISTTANVATKAELQAALANDNIKTIVLTADIDYGTDQLAIAKAITLDLGGKTLTTRNAWGGMSIKNNPTVKNGNIVHASNTAAIKVWNATAFENLVIDVQGKGDEDKTIGGIVLQSGSTTKVGSIKNVTINGAALTNGIETYNCGDATENVIGAMENVTIDAKGTGLLISAPCGKATKCDIKGGVNAVEIFIKGNYSASLELEASTVGGGVYAHDEFSSNPSIVNNGTLKFTADEATTGASAADVTLEIARAEAEKVQGVLNDIMTNAQAKVNNVYYATLDAAIKAAKAGATVELLADVTLAGGYADATEGLRIEKEITLNGNNHTIDCGNFQKGIRVYNPSNVGDFNVNFNNVKVVNKVANGRCIDTRSGNINLKVNSSTLIATNGNSQPLTIGGNDPVHRVTLNGTTIDAGTSGYAVISFVSTNVDIQGVNNSTISGFAAFYLKGDAKTTNLNLGQGVYTGINNHAVESGLFGTVVLEGDNNVVNLMGTNATVKAIANNTAPQAAFLVRGANNTIKVTKESAKIITEGNAYEAIVDADNAATTKFIDMGVERKLVAEADGRQFYSFEDAVRFAGNEGTIKIVNDFELADTWTIPADKKYTLDLNGKTISQTKECTASYEMINNKGNLTITGEGKISFKDTSAGDPNFGWGSYTVRNEGTLVVENGTIEHKGAQDFATHMICAIFQYSGSTTINGGTISTPNYRSARLWKGEMTINGGTFDGQVWVQAVDNTAKLIVNGGTFEPNGNDASAVFVTNNQYDVQLAVTGGTFNGKVGCSDAAKLANAITGGKFNAAAVAGTNVDLIAFGYEFGAVDTDGYKTVYNDESVLYIETLADLKAFRDEVNSGANYYAGVNVCLAADIDMTGENWVGIGSAAKDHGFMGNFDGKNFKIKNLTIDNPALDSEGYAYAGLFGVTEGTDKNNQNTIKNLTIENVTINTTGQIVAAAIAYPYYTIVDSVKVCGNIAINGGDYTAGVLAYTRRCVNASNLSVVGNTNSFVKGNKVVGGVISDIQTNGGLVADYENFSAEGITVSGAKCVGAISGIISGQNLDNATVKNVTLESQDGFAGIVAGRLGTASTVTNVSYENVTGAATLIGGGYDSAKAVQAKIGNTYYQTLEAALKAEGNEVVELLAPVTVAKDETVVLDLNGKTVTYTSAVAGEDMITNRGNLTITDSSDAKSGKLAYVNTDATASNVTVSTISTEAGSTLVVNGGTIENKTVKADGSSIYSFAIDMLTNGNLGDVNVTINGGTVYSDYMAIRQFNNGTACKNSLTINGGYIYGAKRAVQVHMDNNAAVTAIKGGKVEAGEGGYAICNFAATSDLAVTGGEFIGTVYSARENFISGGIYNNPVEAAYCAAGYMPNKNTDGTYGVVAAQDAVAAVGGFAYVTLAEAIAAVQAGDNTIELLADCAENVTIAQVNGTNIVLDGKGKKYTGTITVKGDGVQNNLSNTETLTFQKINFEPASGKYAIDTQMRTYARNITVDNCKFNGNNDVYAIRARNAYNYTVKNTTAEGVYTFFNAQNVLTGLTVENVSVKCANVAFSGAYGFGDASFKNVTVESDNNGVKVNNPNVSALTFENCSITAKAPVTFVESADYASALTAEFKGTNTMVVNNGGTYWFDIVEADGVDATFKAVVNGAALDMSNTAFAASVGNVYYSSLQKAIDAAVDGDEVVVARNIELNAEDAILASGNLKVMVNVVGKNITLDMNGKEISLNHQGTTDAERIYAVLSVEDGAGLTVTGKGTIDIDVNDETPKVVYMFLQRGSGYLVIKNGKYHMDDTEDSMVYTTGDEVVTINGGTFILDKVGSRPNLTPWILNTKGNNERQIIVNGGTFNYDINHQYRPFEVFVPENLAVKANGDGTWTIVTAQAYVTELLKDYVNEPGSREHKVGYATVAEAIAATNNLGKTVTIVAGDYTANLNVNKGITVQGAVDAEGNNLVTFNGKLNITADGATVKNINVNNGGNSAGYVGAKDVVVDGCQVVGGNGFRSCYTSGTVTFKNSYINGGTYGIHFDGNAGGNIVIENCTVIGWTSFAAAIDSVAISGTTFAEGNYNQLRLYQNATITECTFNENMSVDFGNNGNVVAFENCTVENGKALIDVIYIADIAEGNEVTIDGKPIIVAAKIDSKYYLSLQAAIDAATVGQEVTIVSNIALANGVTVAADDNIFINLNGKTVSMKDATAATAALIKNNGTLTIVSSVDGGKLSFETTTPSAANAYASNTISNYGTLTINAGTVENLSTGGACYALDNYAGSTATINGGKLTAEKTAVRVFNWTNGEANAAELNVVGGEIFSNDGYGININAGNAPYVALNISGGTITTNDTDYNLAVYVVNKNSAENFTANISGGTFNGNLALNGVTSTTMAKGNVSVSGGTFDGVICYGEPACQFITGGSYMTEFTEDYLVYGYQLTGNAAPYEAKWTGCREVVTIVDNGKVAEFANENDITVGTLTYKRDFGTTTNQSFYVPFEVPMSEISDDFNVYYISNMHAYDKNEDAVADSLVLEAFKLPANAVLKANYPYIIRAKVANTEMNIELSEAKLYEAEEKYIECSSVFMKFKIQGVYSRRVGPEYEGTSEYEGTYLLSGGTWKKMGPATNLNAFRLGMTITETGDSPYTIPSTALQSIGIRIAGEQLEDGTTVIYHVEAENNSEDVIFDLSGRRVLKAEKGGIYIINGKKVLVK